MLLALGDKSKAFNFWWNENGLEKPQTVYRAQGSLMFLRGGTKARGVPCVPHSAFPVLFWKCWVVWLSSMEFTYIPLIILLSFVTPALTQCYYPGPPVTGGTLAANFTPCDPFAFTSLCCPSGWTCFSNNLCVVTDPNVDVGSPLGTAIRGACTNPQWNTTACGDFCRSKNLHNTQRAASDISR
jgi:hypothetical protein